MAENKAENLGKDQIMERALVALLRNLDLSKRPDRELEKKNYFYFFVFCIRKNLNYHTLSKHLLSIYTISGILLNIELFNSYAFKAPYKGHFC